MNIKEIKEMINLMNENNLMELEVEKDGMRIRLKKTSSGTEMIQGPIMTERQRVAAEALARAAAEPAETSGVKTVEIKAPMVGTFYRAPSPEAPSFVEAGQTIEVGQVICIIEAMKLMNEIQSEFSGRIARILVENSQPVEYGQTLFLVAST